MSRVKFNVNTEYAYIQNFKILQSSSPSSLNSHDAPNSQPLDIFVRHQIDRPLPVEALVKCKMQDNLEFLQWAKRHWDQYYPGGEYDALGRRKASGGPTAPASSSRTSNAGARRGGATPTGTSTANRGPRVGGIGGGGSGRDSALSRENETLKEAVSGLERERDFYFSKLRDIELLIQNAVEADPELEKDEDGLIKHIQAILYSTEVSLLPV
jgi:RP/EB family microtubule-associated protein